MSREWRVRARHDQGFHGGDEGIRLEGLTES
jgi:hypothetical protein